MILTYRPIKVWPEGWPNNRHWGISSPFQAKYSATLELLDRELYMLNATEAMLQVDMPDDGFRLDGGFRANARPGYRGVILTVVTKKHGTLTYPCDRFADWQSNVRAIALGLEALRKLERYGIAQRGQQYAGWAELPSGIAMPAPKLTLDAAARLLAAEATEAGDRCDGGDLLWDEGTACRESVNRAFRAASRLHHPDAGGDAEKFRKLTEARDLLLGSAR